MKTLKAVLPQNSRVIPAKIKIHAEKHKSRYLIALLSLEIAILVALSCLLVWVVFQYKNAQSERLSELRALSAWEKLITKYPKYPEAYYGAALHAKRVGDFEKALEYVNKSLQLNPNFEQSKKLQEELTK